MANIVMVKKSLRKWRGCVDFIDLNMESVYDPYHFLNIDIVIDDASKKCNNRQGE